MNQQFYFWVYTQMNQKSIQKLVYKCSLVGKKGNNPNVWINKIEHTYIMDHNLIIKLMKIQPISQMNLEKIMLIKRR